MCDTCKLLLAVVQSWTDTDEPALVLIGTVAAGMIDHDVTKDEAHRILHAAFDAATADEKVRAATFASSLAEHLKGFTEAALSDLALKDEQPSKAVMDEVGADIEVVTIAYDRETGLFKNPETGETMDPHEIPPEIRDDILRRFGPPTDEVPPPTDKADAIGRALDAMLNGKDQRRRRPRPLES